jgi:hypothetical protein
VEVTRSVEAKRLGTFAFASSMVAAFRGAEREGQMPEKAAAPTQGEAISRRALLLAGSMFGAVIGPAVRAETAAVKHVILLGDSVFDNAAYVGRDPNVRRQVKELLPRGSQATLLARDGATLPDLASQLRGLPRDATHLVVSAGGNDALRASGVLDEGAASVAAAVEKLAAVAQRFSRDFAAMLDLALKPELPTAVCTIYEPRYPEPGRRNVAATALTVLNDRITREVFSRGLTLIDLRLICDEDADFANPIEPSAHGGAKIARAIARFAGGTAPSAAVLANT